MVSQTVTTSSGRSDAWKAELVKNFVGKRLDEVRTPTLVIDRAILERNCRKLSALKSLQVKARVHVKTHKTVEATALQLEGADTDAIIVSTLAEARAMAYSELARQKKLKQINRMVSVTVADGLEALDALEAYCNDHAVTSKFRVFIKVDCGYHRAGTPVEGDETIQLAKRLASSPHVVLEGLYSHAGHSYSSNNPQEATQYLKTECDMARAFRDLLQSHGVEVRCVSIGATPTVQAILQASDAATLLEGIDEVHCGAYTLLDRQQMATGLCSVEDVAVTVACRVASVYADRVLLDGGALAFSKDTAPQGGFGMVLGTGDTLTKVSQEHGILSNPSSSYRLGQVVRVVPNHCCLTAACHLYYLVVDDEKDTIKDVWVPVRGW
ncbi:hypothetical protein EC973_001104 [Apophysomyces ossiformis]|uniref:D-serine dehydratase-like domain-containing protein n=1 Tax=Apophysomyces ossiformis TaxID=679940 RepID=A0A8H7BPK4_9FUNG|nr:hypothetical protein EC973_001104 [Apophysomyces ossiformis]